MRFLFRSLIALTLLVPSIVAQSSPSNQQDDVKAIQQIEDAWLRGERTSDISAFDRVLADDYVNLTQRGIGPGKAKIIDQVRAHAGQAPPYSVDIADMHIYILGDVAVAAFVKTYTAKENGNVMREDNTHIFKKDRGAWKLKISRESDHSGD